MKHEFECIALIPISSIINSCLIFNVTYSSLIWNIKHDLSNLRTQQDVEKADP